MWEDNLLTNYVITCSHIIALLHVGLCLSHDMCLYQVIMTLHFLNDVVDDIIHEIDNYVIIAGLNSESACKLINRIQGLLLLISSLPGWALGMHVESQVVFGIFF